MLGRFSVNDCGSALLGEGHVKERREQGDILRRIELDQRESVLQVCKPPLAEKEHNLRKGSRDFAVALIAPTDSHFAYDVVTAQVRLYLVRIQPA
jgi:hypothetical protein